ncbi:hypothetical protein CFRA_07985 [Corynebacterium frankenforstense DSM 45800]|uniref:Uncharacterized protein n=1 Tax=Corynebacterium frankenforstense DSM 45800 TaxID=1437875 RepID=A0A1L7CTM1_9CORY|nr:hypothetical protein CFRA_07985 [Corynebacterium frankenforstense DSM 45800]
MVGDHLLDFCCDGGSLLQKGLDVVRECRKHGFSGFRPGNGDCLCIQGSEDLVDQITDVLLAAGGKPLCHTCWACLLQS